MNAIIAGEAICAVAVAVTEPGAGSDVNGIRTDGYQLRITLNRTRLWRGHLSIVGAVQLIGWWLVTKQTG